MVRHIAFVIPGLASLGGAERQVLLLAHGLRRRGWRVSVVCLSGGGGASAVELNEAGIERIGLQMRHGLKDPMGWFRFHRWLKQAAPDVVHAHLPHAVWLARWSRMAAPVRALVDTIHTTATGSMGRRLGYRLSNWLSDGSTAVSQAVAESWQREGLVAAEQVTVLPNGVVVPCCLPTSEERYSARQELGLGDGFYWLAAGRLEAVKDYPTLLRAFSGLPASANLAIAGVGSQLESLRRLADELGLRNSVKWLGFVPDLSQWMVAADGFVLSSQWEGLPVALLEAEAMGLPVVATDGPGISNAMEGSSAQWLAPIGDADGLLQRMSSLMALDAQERQIVADRAYQFVRAHFSLESVLDRWEQLFNDMLRQNKHPHRWRG